MKKNALLIMIMVFIFLVGVSCKEEVSKPQATQEIPQFPLEKDVDFIVSDGEFLLCDMQSNEQKEFMEENDLEVEKIPLPFTTEEAKKILPDSFVYDNGFGYIFSLKEERKGDFFLDFVLLKIDLKTGEKEELQSFKREEYLQLPRVSISNQYIIWLEEDINRKLRILAYDLLQDKEILIRSCVADDALTTTRFENFCVRDGYICWYEFQVKNHLMEGNLFCQRLEREIGDIENGILGSLEEVTNLGEAILFHTPYAAPNIYNGYTTKNRIVEDRYLLDVVRLSQNQISFSLNLPYRPGFSWTDGQKVFWQYSLNQHDIYCYDKSKGEYKKIKNTGESGFWALYNLKEIYLKEKIDNTGILMVTQLRDKVNTRKTKERKLYYFDLEGERAIQLLEENSFTWPGTYDGNRLCEIDRKEDGSWEIYLIENKEIRRIREELAYSPERDRERMEEMFCDVGIEEEYNSLEEKEKALLCELYFTKQNRRKLEQAIAKYFVTRE